MPGTETTTEITEALAAWCGREVACECGEVHSIPTRQCVVSRGATAQVADVLAQCSEIGPVACVGDENTWQAAGDQVAAVLAEAGRDVTAVHLPGDCHADEASLGAVAQGIGNARAAVAVGAGTINDLVKLAATDAGIPYIVVPTAPSMNGFTSRIGAVLKDGVKRTLPATPAFAVIADLDVLAVAPADMIAAGLADLQARRCAASDWRMSSLLHDEYYCSLPFEMMRETEQRCQAQAEGIRTCEPEAIETLTAGLLLSGFSMVVAGSSAPASGGEHLLSHFWEMTRCAAGKETILHGLQVGIGVQIAGTLYQRLREWDPASFDVAAREQAYPTWEQEVESIAAVYGPLTDAVVEEYAGKYQPWEQKEAHLRKVLAAWDEMWAQLATMAPDPRLVRQTLQSAGAPMMAADVGLSRHEVVTAVRWARCLRARYTILDLAWDLGLLDEWTEPLLADSGVV